MFKKYLWMVLSAALILSSPANAKPLSPTEVHAAIQKYGPIVKLHPKEQYLLISPDEYIQRSKMTNGKTTKQQLSKGNFAQYYKELSQEGPRVWLEQVSLKRNGKGNMESAKTFVHVRPGGGYTDLKFWYFYAFNGTATVRIQVGDVVDTRPFVFYPLGEHYGDWENVTLRIDNKSKELYSVFLSQHDGGERISNLNQLKRRGSKIIVYASLNGHAFYRNPGDNKHRIVHESFGLGHLDVDTYNYTSDGGIEFDSSKHFEIFSENKPYWVNGNYRWGPDQAEFDPCRASGVLSSVCGALGPNKIKNDIVGPIMGNGAQNIGSKNHINDFASLLDANRDRRRLTSGDFNGDGRDDLVFQNDDSNVFCGDRKAAILLSNPADLSYRTVCPGFDANRKYAHLLVGDINGDKKDDIVLQPRGGNYGCGNGRVVVYLSKGDGTFQEVCPGFDANGDHRTLKMGDFNGDKKMDLVLQADNGNVGCGNGKIKIWTSLGNGHFNGTCNGIDANRNYRSLTAADVTGDGKDDLIIQPDKNGYACGAGQIAIYKSLGDSKFSKVICPRIDANRTYRTTLTGYFNDDKKVDMLVQPGRHDVGCGNGKVVTYLSKGNGYFHKVCPGFDANRDHRTLKTGDFNGDKLTDLVFQNDNGNVACGNGQSAFYLSDGTGHFNLKCTGFDANRNYRTLIPTDINGDGYTDIVLQNNSDSNVACGNGRAALYISDASQSGKVKPVKCNILDEFVPHEG